MGLFRTSLGLLLVALFLEDSHQFGQNTEPFDIIPEDIFECNTTGKPKISFEANRFYGNEEGVRRHLMLMCVDSELNKEEFEALYLRVTFRLDKNNTSPVIHEYGNNFCNTAEFMMKDAYNEVREKMGLEKDECAIAPDFYNVQDWCPWAYLPTPMLEFGRYIINMELLLEEKIVGCVGMGLIVKPISLDIGNFKETIF